MSEAARALDAERVERFPGAVRPLDVLITVNVDWFFWSHRLPVARALRDAGHRVAVAAGTEDEDYEPRIEAEGFGFHRLALRRGSRGPVGQLAAVRELLALYRRKQPDVVHHVTIKPVLYGTVAARLAGIPCIVNAISGLGYVSCGAGLRGELRRRAALAAYRLALASPRVRAILQNPEDADLFGERGIVAPERIALIRGSGVDLERFAPAAAPGGVPVVLFASRLLWDKGVAELIEAARRLRGAGHRFRLVLAGRIDRENPRGIPEAQIRAWAGAGLCEWRGLVADMPALLREASIVALPSYREGVPKILLEAAACGRPIVATDVAGCREVARHGENAWTVPPRDVGALAAALARLLDDEGVRLRLGRAGREIAVREFGEAGVVAATLALYDEVARELNGA